MAKEKEFDRACKHQVWDLQEVSQEDTPEVAWLSCQFCGLIVQYKKDCLMVKKESGEKNV